MKLLSPKEAKPILRKQNDELIDTSLRLSKLVREKHAELNTLKGNYDPEKVRAKAEFDAFCKDLNEKKGRLLEELSGIQKEIDTKKDIYFGIVAKQDSVEERIYKADRREESLNLREKLISELEQAWKTKTQ